MDPMSEEQLDYGEEDYGGSQKNQYAGSGVGVAGGAIPGLADDDLMGDDEEYDDLYNDVNVGEGFSQTLQQQRPEPAAPVAPVAPFGNGSQKPGIQGSVGSEVKDSKPVAVYQPAPDQKPQTGNAAFQGGGSAPIAPKMGVDPGFGGGPPPIPAVPAAPPMPVNRVGPVVVPSRPPMGSDNAVQIMPSVDNSGPTTLFVGELHWWTTDAELESVLSQYGRVKEIKFFDERASGKSKGYCQVDFYESAAAAACKEGMNGHLFNGRACVVTFASPQTMKQMAGGFMNKNQAQVQTQMPGRRADGVGRGGGMNLQGGGDGGRNFGRGGWGGRGGQGMINRGQGGSGPMRGRGVMGAKGMMGAAGAGVAGGPFGQGLVGPGLGGPAGGMMHPQAMMGAGFDPTYMARGGPYGGFPAPAFPGMMPPFQGVGTVGLPGVAPHVNPAFFGRGMTTNGMGMMGGGAMDGQAAGMWGDANTGGWNGEEHGRRTRESSYGGDDGGSDYGYGEMNPERGGRSMAPREKERGSERDWSGSSERRHRDEREQDWERSDRDRYREEKDGYRDHRQRDRERDNEDDWERGQSSSRSRSKSRMTQEEEYRSRSRDADYGKRRRVPSE